jgi:hypothetical protein
MANDKTKRTFDDLIGAAVEETQRDECAAEAQRQVEREALDLKRMTGLKSVLETCLDPVIMDACAVRYEATTRMFSDGRHAWVQAVLTVDGETWTIWTYSWERARMQWLESQIDTKKALFAFEGPQDRDSPDNVQCVNNEKLHTPSAGSSVPSQATASSATDDLVARAPEM